MTWWGRLLGKKRLERQMDSELRFHLAEQIRAYIAQGMSEADARRRAHLEFGGMEGIREECREVRGTKWVEDLFKDLRYAGRTFRNSPVFTAVVVFSLALGIGANTALFSVIEARFLRKLPVENPDQLVYFSWWANGWLPQGDVSGTFGSGANTPFLSPMFDAFRKSGDPLSDVIASGTTTYGASAILDGEAERVSVQLVSGNFFSALGTPAVMGRTFNDNDDRPAATPTAMISHSYWHNRFKADPDVLGKVVVVNGVSLGIIGITPRGFRGIMSQAAEAPNLWMPLSMSQQIANRKAEDWWLHVVGRIQAGTNMDQVRGRLEGVHRALALEASGTVPPIMRLNVSPGSRGIPEGGSDAFFIGLIIAGLVLGFLLLIVCLNVANLLLARAASRQHEILVRRAIGANRFRVIRQLLTESVLLALIGGVLGSVLAYWGKDAFGLLPGLGEEVDLRINLGVLAVTALVSLGTSVVFGLVPAVQATAGRGGLAIGRGVRTFQGSDSRIGRLLLAFQVAMSVVLLAGAVLLIRMQGFWQNVDPGFQTNNLVVFQISPRNLGYEENRIRTLLDQITQNLAAIPGVFSTSISDPFFGTGTASSETQVFFGTANIFVEGGTDSRKVRIRSVSRSFFDTFQVPVLTGRSFASGDYLDDARVAVIDETLARALFGGSNAIGRRIGYSPERSDIEVVAVVKDVRVPGFSRLQHPTVYLPQLRGLARTGQVSIAVRTATNPVPTISAIRKAVAGIDRDIPVEDIKTIHQGIQERLMPVRYVIIAWSSFGATALLLTCIGLFGLMSYFVERHTKEIGIRIALGARRREVVRLVMGRCLFPVSVGLILGLAVSWPVHEIIRQFVYGASLYDPLTFGVVVGVLFAVAGVAGYVPARRASRADPTTALRQE